MPLQNYGEDNRKYVVRDHSYDIMKPTVDGEPSYEQIPQGHHDPKEPYWQAQDVRRYAYWHDPVSGVYSFLKDATHLKSLEAVPPEKHSGQNDWMLVIKRGLTID